MADRATEHDRRARLLKLEHLLAGNPAGVTLSRMAEHCGVSKRTVLRDLISLDEQGIVPVYEDEENGTWKVLEGYFLPPIHLTLPEAMTLFLAARLLLGYGNAYNPHVHSTFLQLNSVVPSPLKEHISATIEWMRRQQRNDSFVNNLTVVTDAWLKARPVRIRYRSLKNDTSEERVIEPYFIQPAASEHGTYLLGYCRKACEMRTFKVERIESARILDRETYTVPKGFDANEYLGSALGISVYGPAETVKLRFGTEIARVALETVWHPSQKAKAEPDGTATVTLNVPVTMELVNFVMGWGPAVEVLEPVALRQRVFRAVEAMSRMYGKLKPVRKG